MNKSVNIKFTHHADETRKELLVKQLRKELVNTKTYQTDTGKRDFVRHNS